MLISDVVGRGGATAGVVGCTPGSTSPSLSACVLTSHELVGTPAGARSASTDENDRTGAAGGVAPARLIHA